MFAELMKVKASEQVGNRWSKEEMQIFCLGKSLTFFIPE
jgi:hypothetical protein